jgi:hypothetical protein
MFIKYLSLLKQHCFWEVVGNFSLDFFILYLARHQISKLNFQIIEKFVNQKQLIFIALKLSKLIQCLFLKVPECLLLPLFLTTPYLVGNKLSRGVVQLVERRSIFKLFLLNFTWCLLTYYVLQIKLALNIWQIHFIVKWMPLCQKVL